jgi:hypothetical protein
MVISVLLLAYPAQGKVAGFGLGIMAGEPTGLSVKKWLSEKSAVDGGLAWSSIDGSSFQIHADYMRHKFDFTKEFEGRLPFYYGAGARVKFKGNGKGNDDTKIGIRIPAGLTYLFKEEPIDLFIEVVPILNIVPETDVNFNAAVGIRYYLK